MSILYFKIFYIFYKFEPFSYLWIHAIKLFEQYEKAKW